MVLSYTTSAVQSLTKIAISNQALLLLLLLIIIIRNLYSAIMPLGGHRGAGGIGR